MENEGRVKEEIAPILHFFPISRGKGEISHESSIGIRNTKMARQRIERMFLFDAETEPEGNQDTVGKHFAMEMRKTINGKKKTKVFCF